VISLCAARRPGLGRATGELPVHGRHEWTAAVRATNGTRHRDGVDDLISSAPARAVHCQTNPSILLTSAPSGG
jgi:hypothetical protein